VQKMSKGVGKFQQEVPHVHVIRLVSTKKEGGAGHRGGGGGKPNVRLIELECGAETRQEGGIWGALKRRTPRILYCVDYGDHRKGPQKKFHKGEKKAAAPCVNLITGKTPPPQTPHKS